MGTGAGFGGVDLQEEDEDADKVGHVAGEAESVHGGGLRRRRRRSENKGGSFFLSPVGEEGKSNGLGLGIGGGNVAGKLGDGG